MYKIVPTVKKISHNSFKNKIIVKIQYNTNSDKVLTIKFHNKLIHSYIKANKVQHELLFIDLLCYTFVRRRQQMLV